MRTTMMIALPVAILMVGVLGALAIVESRPDPEIKAPETVVPLVRVLEVRLADVDLVVESQGTVSPRTESVLVPEVAGRVIGVSPSFAAGGFFEAGEVLLRIDPQAYREAVVEAEAGVAAAELRRAREAAEAEVAIREWRELGRGEPTPLLRREPQLAEARAARAAAEAALARARRDLERTAIRAPYAGRIRDKRADVGQYVAPGTPLATIYAVDYAEVRLPIPGDEMAYLDLPLDYRGAARRAGPEVILRAEFAGGRHAWRGRIVRTEGEIDPRSRLVHAVARVADPYAPGAEGRPPLAVGMYVEAEIRGRTLRGVAVVPREALREGDRVLVVDGDDRLRFRPVEVLRRGDEEVVVGSGLAAGERLCLSSLAATDGMRVRWRAEKRSVPPIAPSEIGTIWGSLP